MEKNDRSTEIKSVILSFTISSHQLKHVTNRVKPNAHSLINNIGKVQKIYKNKKVKSSLKFDDELFLNEPTIGSNEIFLHVYKCIAEDGGHIEHTFDFFNKNKFYVAYMCYLY